MRRINTLLKSLLGLAAVFALCAGLSAPAEAAHKKAKAHSAKASHAGKHVASQGRHGRAKAHRVVHRAEPVLPDFTEEGDPILRSAAFLVKDQSTGAVLLEKNSDAVLPIASITKLMTAMVALDAHQGLGDYLEVSDEDIDTLRGSRSRLAVGAVLTREDMLRLALMSSENRAASALARYYPGGVPAFVAAMNRKAASLGLHDTHFYDSTGLNAGNVSSARDLVQMVSIAAQYPLIREFTTTSEYFAEVNGQSRAFHNTNPLVGSPDWQIGVSKTGYIRESGKCLVMQAWLKSKPLVIVLLDSAGRFTRVADAERIKRWLEGAIVSDRGQARRSG